jgi:hypothetical protein
VVEAEEVEALASFRQVHDPRLGLFRLEPELGQQRPERGERAPGLGVLILRRPPERFGPSEGSKYVQVPSGEATRR